MCTTSRISTDCPPIPSRRTPILRICRIRVPWPGVSRSSRWPTSPTPGACRSLLGALRRDGRAGEGQGAGVRLPLVRRRQRRAPGRAAHQPQLPADRARSDLPRRPGGRGGHGLLHIPGRRRPLLEAFPGLRELALRGGEGLRFPVGGHDELRVLRVESGGLPGGGAADRRRRAAVAGAPGAVAGRRPLRWWRHGRGPPPAALRQGQARAASPGSAEQSDPGRAGRRAGLRTGRAPAHLAEPVAGHAHRRGRGGTAARTAAHPSAGARPLPPLPQPRHDAAALDGAGAAGSARGPDRTAGRRRGNPEWGQEHGRYIAVSE